MINIIVYCLINYVYLIYVVHTRPTISYCIFVIACDVVLVFLLLLVMLCQRVHCKLVPALNGLPSQNKVIH